MSNVPGKVSANLTQVVSSAIEYLDDFRPQAKSVRYNYRDSTSEMTFLIDVPDSRKRKFGELKIPISEGYRFRELFCLPDYNTVDAAYRSEDGYITFDPSDLPGHREYIIKLTGEVSPDSLTEIVDLKVPNDPKKGEASDIYWLHSAIKRPGVMKDVYDDLKVDDVDLGVQVGVQRCFTEAIPGEVLEIFDRTNELLKASNEDDRNQVHKASRRRYKARTELNTSPAEAADIIRSLASAEHIRDYLSVDEPYHRRNIDPRPPKQGIHPETIAVDVSTDLSLDRKAADGELTFEKNDYGEYVRDEIDRKVF